MTRKVICKKSGSLWLLAYTLFFLVLSLAKAPDVLLNTRFWAEEGVYFAHLRTLEPWQAIGFVYNGSLQLLLNATVYAALKVPLVLAPRVTTYTAFLVQLLVVVQIYQFTAAYQVNRLVGLLLVGAWAFLPATYETGATITNVQWICSVSMLFVLLMPSDEIEGKLGRYAGWTFVCGLTGVTSCMMVPFFLVRAYVDRSKEFAVLAGILIGCAVLQLTFLYLFGAPHRSFSFGPRLLTLPTLLQTVLAPLFGVGLTETVARAIREGQSVWWATTGVYVFGGSLMSVAIIGSKSSSRRRCHSRGGGRMVVGVWSQYVWGNRECLHFRFRKFWRALLFVWLDVFLRSVGISKSGPISGWARCHSVTDNGGMCRRVRADFEWMDEQLHYRPVVERTN